MLRPLAFRAMHALSDGDLAARHLVGLVALCEVAAVAFGVETVLLTVLFSITALAELCNDYLASAIDTGVDRAGFDTGNAPFIGA